MAWDKLQESFNCFQRTGERKLLNSVFEACIILPLRPNENSIWKESYSPISPVDTNVKKNKTNLISKFSSGSVYWLVYLPTCWSNHIYPSFHPSIHSSVYPEFILRMQAFEARRYTFQVTLIWLYNRLKNLW